MSRKILCEKCGAHKPMHPEDVLMGFKRRRVEIRAKKPEVHDVKFYTDGKLTETKSLPSLMCDNCGDVIEDGDQAIAETMWRGDDEPEKWEQDYQ